MDLTKGEFITVLNRSGKELNLLLRRCVPEDIDAVVGLQDKVVQKIASDMRAEKSDPETDGLRHFHGQDMRSAALFISDPREELEYSLENDYAYAVFHEDRMVGFSLLIIGGVGEKNLGTVLGYDDEHLLKCVNLETTFIDPDYRGYGLQAMFGELRLKEAARMGATEALTSVSPDNEKSLANLLRLGFVPVKEVVIYFGLKRLIMRKDL